MNALTDHQHLNPTVAQRDVPAEMIAALQARFGTNCSTALVIREQHGRDESPSHTYRRQRRWCLPRTHKTWPMP